jgi:hypothetical protein
LWSNNLIDTDKVMESFYTGCAEAGPDGCALWARSPADIKANLTAIMESVRSRPIPMRTKAGYGLLDYAMLRTALFIGLYNPYESFPILAQGFAELGRGNATRLFDRMNPKAFQCNCDNSDSGDDLPLLESGAAVLCNDGIDVPGNLLSAEKYFKMMMETSSWSDVWAWIRLGCVYVYSLICEHCQKNSCRWILRNWPKFPKDHFQGPFNASTSHPLLLVGNTAGEVLLLTSPHSELHEEPQIPSRHCGRKSNTVEILSSFAEDHMSA